jgi:hypothetical protein
VSVSVALTGADRERGPVKVRTTVAADEPEVSVRFAKVAVVFTVDRLDPSNPRWIATGPGDARSVVHGAGDVERAVSAARQAAGIPDHRRPVPSKLTVGEPQPKDTIGARR